MPTRMIRRWAAFTMTSVIASLATPAVVHAQTIILQVDAKNGAVRLANPRERGRMVDSIDERTFRLRHESSVQLQVVNTNTATYHITAEESAGPAPAVLGTLLGFLPTLSAYLPELQYMAPRGRTRGGQDRTTLLPVAIPENLSSSSARLAEVGLQDGRAVETELHALDAVLHGSRGVDGVRDLSLRTLDRMRTGNVEDLARAMADSLGVPDQSCSAPKPATQPLVGGVHLGQDILSRLEPLRPAVATLQSTLSNQAFATDPALSELHATLEVLQTRGDSALRDGQGLVTAGYGVDDMATTVMSACSHWDAPPVKISTTAGRTVTVTIEPSQTPEMARVATKKDPQKYQITLMAPIDRLEARLGLTGLYMPQAQFRKYGLRSIGGTAPQQIYVSDFVDDRFAAGLSLGLTWHPWFDWKPASVALWLPEVTVGVGNPRAFAIGGAVSYHFVKFGMGAAIIKHQVLDTLGVGQTLPNASFLKTHDTYAHPLTYFSITVFHIGDLISGETTKSDAPKSGAPKK